MNTFPYFIQICFHSGGSDADVVFCREDNFLENFTGLMNFLLVVLFT